MTWTLLGVDTLTAPYALGYYCGQLKIEVLYSSETLVLMYRCKTGQNVEGYVVDLIIIIDLLAVG